MSLNEILHDILPSYVIPATPGEAAGRAIAVAACAAASYMIGGSADDKTGIAAIDDFLVPATKATLMVATAGMLVLAADTFYHHYYHD